MMSAAKLKLVTQRSPAEEMLADLVPELQRAEETVAALHGLIDGWRRQLARERGVAFVREEAVRREFGTEETL